MAIRGIERDGRVMGGAASRGVRQGQAEVASVMLDDGDRGDRRTDEWGGKKGCKAVRQPVMASVMLDGDSRGR